MSTELNRRIGAAWAEFCKYERAWKHTAITVPRKLELFQALVTSKLMYSLNTAWLNKAERRRLDGFQARCLRKVLHIPPAFLTHISNKVVLQRAGQQPYTAQLLRHQLTWFGKIGRASNQDFLRQLTFQDGSIRSATASLKRRRGRPMNAWASCLRSCISRAFASDEHVMEHVRDPPKWEVFVQRFTKSLGLDPEKAF